MSLFNQITYSKAPILKNHQEFYGDYEDLNNIGMPSDDAICKFQFDKLELFQKQAFKKGGRAKELNNFLFSTNPENLNEVFSNEIANSLNNINEEIRSMISQGYHGKKVRENIKNSGELEKVKSKLNRICDLVKDLKKDSDKPISSKYIDMLYDCVKDFNEDNIDKVLGNLFSLQGEILESIGVEFFKKRIPQNIKVVNTGSLGVGGEMHKGQQHISDILILDSSGSKDWDEKVKISYKIGENTFDSVPLNKFLGIIESYKGSSRIILTDESNKTLTDLSLASIQAKSGVNQLPWNTSSKNTWVDLKPNDESRPLNSYVNFLERIWELCKSWAGSENNIKRESDAYDAMANYILGAQLSKVLHLSQADNQYVLTPKGLMTYTERIEELYNKLGEGYPFRFKGRINMGDKNNILEKRRAVLLKRRKK